VAAAALNVSGGRLHGASQAAFVTNALQQPVRKAAASETKSATAMTHRKTRRRAATKPHVNTCDLANESYQAASVKEKRNI
jgi:hypothetical protein